MNIVLLAAGTSSRMGKTNKLLLPCNNMTMVANSAMQALYYLSKRDDNSVLIIVTGYRRLSTLKALKVCRSFIEKTDSKLKLVIVNNKDYKAGQFSSLQTGVKETSSCSPFFVSLADMPLITEKHYKELEDKLDNYDAVRVSCNSIPGHPVLFNSKMRALILESNKNSKMSEILKKCNLKTIEQSDDSWTRDVDTSSDLNILV